MLKDLTFGIKACYNNNMNYLNNYSIEDLKEENAYINSTETTSWLQSANDAMVDKLEAKHESNPEEEFYKNQ